MLVLLSGLVKGKEYLRDGQDFVSYLMFCVYVCVLCSSCSVCSIFFLILLT